MDDTHGCWMYDTLRSEGMTDKLWITRSNNTSFIYEYNKKDDVKSGRGRIIKLPYPFKVFTLSYKFHFLNYHLIKRESTLKINHFEPILNILS